MTIPEIFLYLVIAGLLFPAFGGGIWLLETLIRKETGLGRSIPGGTRAKVIAGAAWFALFLAVVWVALALKPPFLAALGILAWEAVGMYGAYRWFELQEILTIHGRHIGDPPKE